MDGSRLTKLYVLFAFVLFADALLNETFEEFSLRTGRRVLFLVVFGPKQPSIKKRKTKLRLYTLP